MSEHCPYCNAELEIDHDGGSGYGEGEQHQQQCGSCEKTFVFTTEMHFSYDLSKADCLNDGEHVWKETITYPKEFTCLRCETCGEEKPLAVPYKREDL